MLDCLSGTFGLQTSVLFSLHLGDLNKCNDHISLLQ